MRADNTGPLINAARQRHELTRAKAIQALRELDQAGTRVTFEAVARAAGVARASPAPGSTPKPISASRSDACARPPTARHHHRSPPASAPPTHPCCSG